MIHYWTAYIQSSLPVHRGLTRQNQFDCTYILLTFAKNILTLVVNTYVVKKIT